MGMSEDPIASAVLHKFLIIYRHLRQYHRQMDRYGVRPRQASVLRFLVENGPAPVGAVQAYLYTSPSTASSIISQLEEAGHITRERSPEDNRVVIVTVTESGRDIAQRAPVGGIGLLRQGLGSLPDERLSQMEETLDEMMRLMEIV